MEALLAHRDAEGLTFHQLAELTDIPVGTLSSWSRKLRAEAEQRNDDPTFVEIEIDDTAAPATSLELHLPNGTTITVEPGFDAALLRDVVAALAC